MKRVLVTGGAGFIGSHLIDFFSSETIGGKKSKPQQITHEFVVAKNLKPGESREFRVYFDYPPYFRNVAHFAKIYAH